MAHGISCGGPVLHSIDIRPKHSGSADAVVLKTNDAAEALAWITVLTNPLANSVRPTAALEPSDSNATLPVEAVKVVDGSVPDGASEQVNIVVDAHATSIQSQDLICVDSNKDISLSDSSHERDLQASNIIMQLQQQARKLSFDECTLSTGDAVDNAPSEDSMAVNAVSASAPAHDAAQDTLASPSNEDNTAGSAIDTPTVLGTATVDVVPVTSEDTDAISSMSLSFTAQMAASSRSNIGHKAPTPTVSHAIPLDINAPISVKKSAKISECKCALWILRVCMRHIEFLCWCRRARA